MDGRWCWWCRGVVGRGIAIPVSLLITDDWWLKAVDCWIFLDASLGPTLAGESRDSRAAKEDDDLLEEEGITWEDQKKEEERQQQLKEQERKYGAVPMSTLKNIPQAAERGRRHIPTVYDPNHDKGT